MLNRREFLAITGVGGAALLLNHAAPLRATSKRR
jgi:TAT (twin-arginine translocation) pathway signal sequence